MKLTYLSNRLASQVLALASIVAGLSGCGGSSGGSSGPTNLSAGTFAEVKLVSDLPGVAAVTDPNLKNPWGISFSPTGAFWVSDNTTGLSTLYNTSGNIVPLVVTIPAAGGGSNGPISGQVFNPTSDFVLPGGKPAAFIFDSEDGILSAWNGGTVALQVSDQSARGSVYKGMAIGTLSGANFLYATNFNSGFIDVFDKTFTLTKSFSDSSIPTGYAPFGISNIGGALYVTFAKQDAAKHDDVAGAGNGYIDVFGLDGTLIKRLASNGSLNSPWGLASAPSGFGNLGGDLLVGNFGDGKINAYNPTTGKWVGSLSSKAGGTLVVPGLWGLIFGNGGTGGTTGTLYFTSGPNGENDGLMGSISP